MFENLSQRLQGIFSGLKTKGRLSEEDINAALKEVRMALLEADVNFKVVKNFCNSVKERALTSEILNSLTPAQNVIKVVTDELATLLGGEALKIDFAGRIPGVIMLLGLQGCGKTTAASKLAYRLGKQGHSPLLVACDTYRPAAADQLQTLADEQGVRCFRGDGKDPVKIAEGGVRDAIDNLRDVVIVDTAGRLHVDDDMMQEAVAIRNAIKPDYVFLVVDAMTGQDAVNVATSFAEQVDFDAVIMSKMDGDARGGGALSIREVTGKPIAFISVGEKADSLETFHPDRMAKRILGMGDVLSVIEKAVETQEREIEEEQAKRIARAEFNFDDYKDMMAQTKKMGGISKILEMMPGGNKALAAGQVDESALDRIEVIINSMTKAERAKPSLLNGSRRARIAAGCGLEIYQVNQMIKQFGETRKMVKKMSAAMSQGKGKKGKKGKRRGRMKISGMGDIDLSRFM